MDTRDFMTVLETVGIPAAFAVAAGWMVYKLFNALIADVHKKLLQVLVVIQLQR